MNTYVHAPSAKGSPAKGFRTKSARRRSGERQERHLDREKRSRRERNRMQRARRARRLDGWWPPEPMPPGPPIRIEVRLASEDDDRRRLNWA